MLHQKQNFLFIFYFILTPEVDNSFVIERFDEEEGDGKNENSHNAEEPYAEIHAEKRNNGMNADIH